MTIDQPGFADPATDSQSCFRALLDAMSRPGTIHPAGTPLDPPTPLDPATASVLLTLADADTPLWLEQPLQPAWDWLAFHSGAPPADAAGSASFVCALSMPPLATLDQGSDEAPEASATLILQVAAIGQGTAYRLSGPGLQTPTTLQVTGLPPDFVAQWATNAARYPCGVDLVLCAGTHLAALPRTLHITEA